MHQETIKRKSCHLLYCYGCLVVAVWNPPPGVSQACLCGPSAALFGWQSPPRMPLPAAGAHSALLPQFSSVQFSSVAQLCWILCDLTDCSTPGFPVHHQLPELAQTHVHWVGDSIQPSHPLSSPSPPAFNLAPYKANTNHWTKLRRAETKRKKEFNLETWEKETSKTISLKKQNNEKAEKTYTKEGTN